MSRLSDAAKAAAIMYYVYDDGDTALTPERAVQLFNALGQSFGPVQDVLEEFDVTWYGPAAGMGDDEWWESLEMMAHTIDAMFDYFEFRSKEQVNESEP